MKNSLEILEHFKSLSVLEQDFLLSKLRIEFEGNGKLLEVVKNETSIKKCCPHCGFVKVHKRGKQKGVQMYKCVGCEKWFSETTGTPLWDIKRKDKWQEYLQCMQKGMAIKKIAKEIGICIQTSFDWRHKILSVLHSEVPDTLEGRIECDEIEIPINQKGDRKLTRKPRKRSSDFVRNTEDKAITTVQVVSAIDQNNQLYFKAIEAKRITAKHLKKTVGKRIEKKATLITDQHPSYLPLVKSKKGLKHKTIKANEHVSKEDSKVNLQKINQQHKQLREFLGKFGGVSTKYLQNYLNWFAYGKKLELYSNQVKQWFVAIITSDFAYMFYQTIKANAVNIRT
jgi:transposase-like protein